LSPAFVITKCKEMFYASSGAKGNMQAFAGEEVSCSHSLRPKITNKFRYFYWEFTMKAY